MSKSLSNLSPEVREALEYFEGWLHHPSDLAFFDILRAELLRLHGERTWRPISEAPRDGSYFLAYGPQGYFVVNEPKGCARGCWHFFDDDWHGEMIGGSESATHWQPLSPPRRRRRRRRERETRQ